MNIALTAQGDQCTMCTMFNGSSYRLQADRRVMIEKMLQAWVSSGSIRKKKGVLWMQALYFYKGGLWRTSISYKDNVLAL